MGAIINLGEHNFDRNFDTYGSNYELRSVAEGTFQVVSNDTAAYLMLIEANTTLQLRGILVDAAAGRDFDAVEAIAIIAGRMLLPEFHPLGLPERFVQRSVLVATLAYLAVQGEESVEIKS